MKEFLSGNEAIARGAYDAGVRFAAGYPGTPSTEILENIAKRYIDIYAEWSPNEKVALEAASGASMAGARALAAMKHVGLNVASDPLMTLSYTGVNAGLVIVTADDPGIHSSQNEQDNRHYAKFAKIPLFEPSDSQEAYDFTRLAFEISERFDTPVILRTTTRVSHSKSLVRTKKPKRLNKETAIPNNIEKFVMIPSYARERHRILETRLKRLQNFSDRFRYNRCENNPPSPPFSKGGMGGLKNKKGKIGIITSGVAYQYVKEVCRDIPVLKLSMTYPLPVNLIKKFAKGFKKVYVVEELDPILENEIKAIGIQVIGKERFPIVGELNPDIIEEALFGRKKKLGKNNLKLPVRTPIMCAGCPYLGIFHTLKKLGLFVAGDIGCYTLAALSPYNAIDSTLCMGAGICQAFGMEKVLEEEDRKKIVAVIGDSTFLHSGITGLMDIVYNKGITTVIILDNSTTAMTGRQDNPSSGFTLKGEETKEINIAEICRALGVERVRHINPFNLSEIKSVILEEINQKLPSVIISKSPCVLLKHKARDHRQPSLTVDLSVCNGCMACLKIGCPALERIEKNDLRLVTINTMLCNGCRLCVDLCRIGAIVF
ncbi:MAG: indolepyruvate ferredoxin oxidoreductase subunit alpha [Nitrospirae bacterium]|nr:indolepyruvate ferredoxin oxidoreductase subunit alpha [Nitrospirota bacterium]